jgi:hypothetical protein
VIEAYRRHQLSLAILVDLPTAHVMAAGDDARPNAFRDPRPNDKVTNLSFNTDQITGYHF